MKQISIDFPSKTIYFNTDSQKGTEYGGDLDKTKLESFIPDKYRQNTCFTWDFENDTFSVNEDIPTPSPDSLGPAPSAFKAVEVIPMPGLKGRHKEFLNIIDYSELSVAEIFPLEMLRLMGLADK